MISDLSFNTLISRMRQFKTMDESFRLQLRPLLHEIDVKKGELILLEGTVPTFIPFIVKGSLREITKHPLNAQEEVTWMWFANDFAYTKPGFFSEEPAECRIEAMEDCQLIYIKRDDFSQFETTFPLARKLAELIRDHHYKLLKKYAFDLAVLNNQERFDQFMAIHPKAMNILVHQHIASFLGIRDKGLARYYNRK